MKKSLTWFLLLCKRQIKNPVLYILFVLVTGLSVVFSIMPKTASTNMTNVGILISEDTDITRTLKAELSKAHDTYKFIFYNDEEKMFRDIRNETLECGYTIPENVTIRLTNSSIGSIKIYNRGFTSIQGSIDEYIYCRLIKACRNQIIQNCVTTAKGEDFDISDVLSDFNEAYKKYEDGVDVFHLDIMTRSAEKINIRPGGDTVILFPSRGILSIIVFMSALLGCITYMQDKEKEIFVTIPALQRGMCKMIYCFVPAVLLALLSMVSLAITGDFQSLGKELGAMSILVIMSVIFAMLVSLPLKRSRIMAAIIPFLLLGCLIVCPIFIKASGYIPLLKYVEKLFVPYYYLSIF